MATLTDRVLQGICAGVLAQGSPEISMETLKGSLALAGLSDRDLRDGITLLHTRGNLQHAFARSVTVEDGAMARLLWEEYPKFRAIVRAVATALVATQASTSSADLATEIGRPEFLVRYAAHFLRGQGCLTFPRGTARELRQIRGNGPELREWLHTN